MGKFQERYSALGDRDVKWQEEEAGINEMGETFGVGLTIKSLTKGDPLKADSLLKVPAETIYWFLLMDQEQSKYNERLAAIYKKTGGA